MKSYHWTIMAYDEVNDKGGYIHPVKVTVNNCLNEDYAIREASIIVSRKHYKLREVWECDNHVPENA